jgi:glycosyltransferase involved in cell wall biosynthesis
MKANTAPLRVAIYEPSGMGGICHYTYQLAEALAKLGCDVIVLTASKYELENLPRQFRVVFLFRPSRVRRLLVRAARLLKRRGVRGQEASGAAGPGRVPSALVGLLRALRLRLLYARAALQLLRLRPDVVHFQSVSRGRDLPLVRLLRRLGFRTVYTAHDLLPHDSSHPAEREALARVYRSVDRLIVHARSNREEMVSEFGADPAKIQLVAHGSYEFLLPEGRIARAEARRRLGLPAAGQIVLFFGLIKRYKGLEYLIEAFRLVERRVPDAKLAIVGGLFSDADGYGYYRDLLDQVSREKNVWSVVDYVPVEKVGLYLLASDVVALPYTRTYQSGVLLAAYAAGRPVVVTDTGGLPEVVEEGLTGFVVPPRDTDALAGAICRVLEDPPRAAAMGERALRLAQTAYSWDRIAGETVRLYRSLTGGGIDALAAPAGKAWSVEGSGSAGGARPAGP